MKIISLFVIILTLTLGACRKANEGAYGSNILKVPLTSEVSTLDPARSYDTVSASVVYQVLEQLYEYHYLKRPFSLRPLLAEGMPMISEGGKKYEIKIKKNVRFHDDPAFKGKPRYLTAHDFVTQIKRLAFVPTKSNGWWLFDQKIKGINEFREKAGNNLEKMKSLDISGVRAKDDHTLVIELNEPYPQMINALAMSFTSPVPMELVDAHNNMLDNIVVGTGPFQLQDWIKSSMIKLVKNPHYQHSTYPREGDRLANDRGLLKDAGKKLPFLDGITYYVLKEAQTRWLNFRKKKIDFLIVPKDNYNTVIDPTGSLAKEFIEESINLQVASTLTYWWVSFNMKHPILGKNLKLRQAIAHAIDVDRYIKVFTNNIGQKANSIYPPGIPGYDPSHQLDYSFNLEKAKALLAKAGHPNGAGLPELTYDTRGNNTTNRQQAEFIKGELAKIGIKVNVVLNTFPGFLEKQSRGKLGFWQDGWALDYPDAENSLQLLHTKNHPPGPNATYYSNPKFDKLFNQLKLMENGPAKFELMREMEKIVQDDLPWVMQFYARNYILYHDRLKNYRHSDMVYNYMKYLRVVNQ